VPPPQGTLLAHQLQQRCTPLRELWHAMVVSEPPKLPVPPFSYEDAVKKVRMAEDAWNTRDPSKVKMAYTETTKWRNRSQFLTGRDEVEKFLNLKWKKELEYRLIKEYWAHTDDRIAVRFAYEYHNDAGLHPYFFQTLISSAFFRLQHLRIVLSSCD
jgi:nuclear transport factor 2 (NTF2) superfamily protein